MAVVFKFPTYHPCGNRRSYFKQGVPGLGLFLDLWRDLALAYEEEAGNTCSGERKEGSAQGAIKIASLPLAQYKPDDISVAIDNESITLHGQHQSEDENGFENREFKKVIKIPEEVDPKSVTSHVSADGSALVFEGNKQVKEKMEADNSRFAVKFDLSGFKPEEIKVQLHGNELTVTGKQSSQDCGFYWSRDYNRRIQLPSDADLSTVMSRLSKEGLLTIEASRDPALLPSNQSVEVTMETVETQPENKVEETA